MPTDDRYDWVILTVASQRLGRSTETIRRQIREGTFEYPSEREPIARGSTKTRFVVGLPKRQLDARRPVTTPQDAPATPDVATAVLDAYERGRAAQRQDDALRRHEDATRIVRQARRIGRLLRENASLDATAAELARQVVEAERRADAAEARLREVERRPWYRRILGR